MGRLSDARKKAKSAKANDKQPAGEPSVSSTPADAEVTPGAPAGASAGASASTGKKKASRKKAQAKRPKPEAESGSADAGTQADADDDFTSLVSAFGGESGTSPVEPEAEVDAAATKPTEKARNEATNKANVLPTSGLADDILAGVELSETVAEKKDVAPSGDEVKPASTGGPGRRELPASGLAEDLLAAWANEQPIAAQRVEKAPAEQPAGNVGTTASPETAEPASSADLPIAGLADEILAGASDADDWTAVLETLKESDAPRSLPSSGLAEDILEAGKSSGGRPRPDIDEIHEFENFFEEEEQAEQMHLVLFGMDNELFGLEMYRVQEIIRVPGITRVPHVEEYIRGVCNLRGRIVPVFDLRRMMGIKPKTIDRMSRIMVLDVRGKQIGMLIDRASEVARVDLADIEPPPEEMRAIDRNLVTAVARTNERMIFILDVDRVMALN